MKQFLLKASIIISIVVIIMSYLELFRYCSMHIKNPDSFTSYQNLERAGTGRVVVLTEGFVSKPYVNSVLDQTVKVDEIACSSNLDNKVKKFVNSYNTTHPLQTALKRERNSQTKIIILNGDTVYCPEFIEELINASNNNKNSIIYGNKETGDGILITSDDIDPEIINDLGIDIDELIQKYKIKNEVDLKIDRNYKCLGTFI